MAARFVRRGTVVSLALVVGLLVAAAGALVVLCVMKQGDAGRVAGEVARTERAIDAKQDRLAAAESTVDELDAERARLDAESRKLHACADPARDSVDAARAGDDTALAAALDKVVRNCAR